MHHFTKVGIVCNVYVHRKWQLKERLYYGKQKTTSLQKVALPPKQNSYEIASGQGLHNSKSMYKVNLHNYMYDVSCHLNIF